MERPEEARSAARKDRKHHRTRTGPFVRGAEGYRAPAAAASVRRAVGKGTVARSFTKFAGGGGAKALPPCGWAAAAGASHGPPQNAEPGGARPILGRGDAGEVYLIEGQYSVR